MNIGKEVYRDQHHITMVRVDMSLNMWKVVFKEYELPLIRKTRITIEKPMGRVALTSPKL